MGKQCKGDFAIVDLGRANHYRLAVPVRWYFYAAHIIGQFSLEIRSTFWVGWQFGGWQSAQLA